jgi:hypothetical protein
VDAIDDLGLGRVRHAHGLIKVDVDADIAKPERILQAMVRHPRKIIVAIDID